MDPADPAAPWTDSTVADHTGTDRAAATARREQSRTLRARRRRRHRLTAAGTAVVVVAVAAGGVAYVELRGGSDPYRVAAVARGSVIERFASVGTVRAVNSAAVSFPVSGTVATVPVVVGQQVKAGQKVATLDRTSLAAALTSAEQDLTSAKDTLATDEAAETAAATTTSTAATTAAAAAAGAADLVIGTGSRTEAVAAVAAAPTHRPRPTPTAVPSSAPTGAPTPSATPSASASAGLAALVAAVERAQANLVAEQTTVDAYLVDARTAATVCGSAASSAPAPVPTTSVGATPSPTTSTPAPSSTPSVSLAPTTGPTTSSSTPGTSDTVTTARVGNAGYSTDVSTLDQCTALLAEVAAQPSLSDIDSTRTALAADLDTAVQALATAAADAGGHPTSTSPPTSTAHPTSTARPTRAAPTGRSTPRATSTPRSTSHSGSGSGSGRTGSTSTSTPSTSRTGSGTSGAGTGSTTGSGGRTRLVTAQQIIADQAAIDSARAGVAEAQQNLSYSALTTPILGKVADVAITAGATVSAGSRTETITVLTPGSEEVSTTVSLTDINRVAVGDAASVTVDGVSTPLTGTVSAIGVQDTASGGSTTFPVTVALAPTTATLFEGSGASVMITATTVSGALTVPTSAVHTSTTGTTVDVVSKGTQQAVAVKVGAVGGVLTQITSGLSLGQQVVVANLDEALPGTTTAAAVAGRFGGAGGGAGRGTRAGAGRLGG